MGYTFRIGEAQIDHDKGAEWLRISAKPATHSDAPAHDPFVGTGNSRSPSYTAWHDFCKEAGIYELFYGQGWSREDRRYMPCSDEFHRETPLIESHPGAVALIPADAEYITAARVRREQTNGGKPPGFWDYTAEHGEIDNGNDHVLARLLWLEFWFRWALDTCEVPIIQNT